MWRVASSPPEVARRPWWLQSLWGPSAPSSDSWISSCMPAFSAVVGWPLPWPACLLCSVHDRAHPRDQDVNGGMRSSVCILLIHIPHGRGASIVSVVHFPRWKPISVSPTKEFLWSRNTHLHWTFFFFLNMAGSFGFASPGKASSSQNPRRCFGHWGGGAPLVLHVPCAWHSKPDINLQPIIWV